MIPIYLISVGEIEKIKREREKKNRSKIRDFDNQNNSGCTEFSTKGKSLSGKI